MLRISCSTVVELTAMRPTLLNEIEHIVGGMLLIE
jgi:hypothetical protein